MDVEIDLKEKKTWKKKKLEITIIFIFIFVYFYSKNFFIMINVINLLIDFILLKGNLIIRDTFWNIQIRSYLFIINFIYMILWNIIILN